MSVDVAEIVARLPGERMTIKQARAWFNEHGLTDVQSKLVTALVGLAERIALQVGERRYHLDPSDAQSIATDYLILAVVAGARDDETPETIKFITKKIKNGLRIASEDQKRERETFTPYNEYDDSDDSLTDDTIENLTGVRPKSQPMVEKLDPRPPLGTPERDKYDEGEWAEIRQLHKAQRIGDDRTVDERDLVHHQFNQVRPDLETPQQRTVWLLVIAGETLDDAAVALRMTRHEVLELARTLAV